MARPSGADPGVGANSSALILDLLVLRPVGTDTQCWNSILQHPGLTKPSASALRQASRQHDGQQRVGTRSRRTSAVGQPSSTGRLRVTSSADWLAGPDPLLTFASTSWPSALQRLLSVVVNP